MLIFQLFDMFKDTTSHAPRCYELLMSPFSLISVVGDVMLRHWASGWLSLLQGWPKQSGQSVFSVIEAAV